MPGYQGTGTQGGYGRSEGEGIRVRGVEFASRLCSTQIKPRLNAPAEHCVAASAGRANAGSLSVGFRLRLYARK